jgi:hypothetical protein
MLAWKIPALLEGGRDTWGRWLLRGFWEGAFGLVDLDARGVRTVALGLLGVGAFGGLAVELLYDVATLPADLCEASRNRAVFDATLLARIDEAGRAGFGNALPTSEAARLLQLTPETLRGALAPLGERPLSEVLEPCPGAKDVERFLATLELHAADAAHRWRAGVATVQRQRTAERRVRTSARAMEAFHAAGDLSRGALRGLVELLGALANAVGASLGALIAVPLVAVGEAARTVGSGLRTAVGARGETARAETSISQSTSAVAPAAAVRGPEMGSEREGEGPARLDRKLDDRDHKDRPLLGHGGLMT